LFCIHARLRVAALFAIRGLGDPATKEKVDVAGLLFVTAAGNGCRITIWSGFRQQPNRWTPKAT
jgi:hypothetical protein